MLIFAAVLPALLLMRYVYRLDHIEKEPGKLLLKIFFWGVLSTIPAIIMEGVMEIPLGIIWEEGSFWYIIAENFIGVALVEEYFKYLAIKHSAWKSREFNYQFDGIVYGVFAALGFAAFENILYVLEEGFALAVLRAVTSVPSHAIDGVTMGYFLGLAKVAEKQGNKKKKKRLLRLAVLIPALEHGIYDAALGFDSDMAMLFWLAFVIVIDLWAIWFVKKASKNDEEI